MKKKLTTALIAAGLVLGAAGCAPPMSTAETCEKMTAIIVGNMFSGSGSSTEGMTAMIEQLEPMKATESPELKRMVVDSLNYLHESVKDNPDSLKESELSKKADESFSALEEVCS